MGPAETSLTERLRSLLLFSDGKSCLMGIKGLMNPKPHRLHHHCNCDVSVRQFDITGMKWTPCFKCGCRLRAEMPAFIDNLKITQSSQFFAFLKMKSRFNNGM